MPGQVSRRLHSLGNITPDQVRSRRKRWNLNQREFGEHIGYLQPQVAKFERGIAQLPRLLELALIGFEMKMLAEGRPLWDDPADYRLIKLGENFYLYPYDRDIPKGVKEIVEVYDEDGKLPAEYWKFPVLMFPSYSARFHWMFTEPEWRSRAQSGKSD